MFTISSQSKYCATYYTATVVRRTHLGWVSAKLLPRTHAIHITSIPPHEKHGHIMQQFDTSKDAAKDFHERNVEQIYLYPHLYHVF